MYLPFDEMPADTRIWIYLADRKFNPEEQNYIKEVLTDFCQNWNTHGSKMPTSYEIKFDQFIILAVDQSQLGASGCSIDSSVRKLKEIEAKLGVDLLNQGKVSFLQDKQVSVTSVPKVKQEIADGNLEKDTLIFNPIMDKKQDLQEKWLLPAKESWLNRFFDN
ncbi:hypothetical protein KIH41_01075 [Litoribacter ruber]|uniref:hypothetical protein n=1 Tax=Litoribacter ruber TaxID=702568 RepID=UPI001BDB1252|nr:hypothetical protein [Litoribacter ruber]MBT0809867.1 hypothetical protein [Litoribacter ruber]